MDEQVKILIIDKDEASRQWLVSSLRSMQAEILEAKSALEGIEIFCKQLPPVVFIDINIEDSTITNLTKKLCAENPDVLITVVAGSSSEELVINLLKAGVSDLLKKPFSAAELRLVISRFLGTIFRRRNKIFKEEHLAGAKLEFELQSMSQALSPAIEYATSILSGFIDEREIMRIELGLQEVLRNAYEHGNLGVSNSEKIEFCETGILEKKLEERSKEAVKAGKLIRVITEYKNGIFSCSIEDEGGGFDWKNVPDPTETPDANSTNLNGRGVLLLKKVFDSVAYNEKGNRVTLTKRLA